MTLKILVVGRAVVGKDMASPGVRSYHIARVLAEQIPDAEVTLSAPNEPDIESPHERMKIVRSSNALDGFRRMLRHDVIISRNFPLYAVALPLNKRLALDYFTPFWIEWMELSKRFNSLDDRTMWMSSNRHYIDAQLTLADYIFCANERQRDVCIGALSMLNLVSPTRYNHDVMLKKLVGVVPYGVQPGGVTHDKKVLKGVVPGIKETDRVVIWNGLIVEWFDTETVIRAIAEVSKVRDDIKLFFLGTNHPDKVTHADSPVVQRAMQLAEELGLLNKSVFFNVGWVPYQEIGNYLAESDIGVCAGFDNIEARYAFRTRFLDLFWAGLPTVCTIGDVLAERIQDAPLGVAVPPGDAKAFGDGILKLVEHQEFYQQCRDNTASERTELSWDRVLEPLVEFCRSGASSAVPKRKRIFPAVRRTMAYLIQRTLVREYGDN